MNEDPAQALYAKKNKSLDLDRTADSFSIWSFGLTAGQIVLIGMWFLYPLFLVASIVGIVFGFISLGKIKTDKKLKGRGFALAGIIIGFLQVIVYFLLTLFFIIGTFAA